MITHRVEAAGAEFRELQAKRIKEAVARAQKLEGENKLSALLKEGEKMADALR